LLSDAGIEPLFDAVPGWHEYHFKTPGKDPILVVPLDKEHTMGLITYVKLRRMVDEDDKQRIETEEVSRIRFHDASHGFIHTLNSVSGFRRKLEALGIWNFLPDPNVVNKRLKASSA
jgi:hypothetical protein